MAGFSSCFHLLPWLGGSGNAHIIIAHPGRQSTLHLPHASRVSCSELFGGRELGARRLRDGCAEFTPWKGAVLSLGRRKASSGGRLDAKQALQRSLPPRIR